MSSNEKTVKYFWDLYAEGKYEETSVLFAPGAVIYWPCTKEIFRNADNLIKVNRQYPGKHKITLDKIISNGSDVVTTVVVESLFEGQPEPLFFFATSFFSFDNGGMITGITEYWADTAEPPRWRIESGLSERY